MWSRSKATGILFIPMWSSDEFKARLLWK